jgi:hypothetical protein
MTLNYNYIKSQQFEPVVHTFGTRDTMLYALGIGCAAATPIAPEDFRYIYEQDLQALPTMATVLAQQGFWAADPRTACSIPGSF